LKWLVIGNENGKQMINKVGNIWKEVIDPCMHDLLYQSEGKYTILSYHNRERERIWLFLPASYFYLFFAYLKATLHKLLGFWTPFDSTLVQLLCDESLLAFVFHLNSTHQAPLFTIMIPVQNQHFYIRKYYSYLLFFCLLYLYTNIG